MRIRVLIYDHTDALIETEDIEYFKNNPDFHFRGCFMGNSTLYLLYHLIKYPFR